jgi:hypothetical protein
MKKNPNIISNFLKIFSSSANNLLLFSLLIGLVGCSNSSTNTDELFSSSRVITFEEIYPENRGEIQSQNFSLDKWSWNQDIAEGATLQEGIHYTLDSNMIPAGLSFQIKINTNRTATFSLLGRAIDHHVSDSVNDINFTFLKDAFLAGSPKALAEEKLPTSINILFGIGYQLSGTVVDLVDKVELTEVRQGQSVVLTSESTNFVFSNRYEDGDPFELEVFNFTGNKVCGLNQSDGTFASQNYDSLILTCSSPIQPTVLNLDAIVPYRTMQYSWVDAQHAMFYYLEESLDGGITYEPVSENIATNVQAGEYMLENSLYESFGAQYRLQSCNSQECVASNTIVIPQIMLNNYIDYLKASNTGGNDNFGHALSISDDGNTLAVGAYYEDSNSTGINGNQDDNSSSNSGAVYIFTRTNTGWSQEAYLKASNSDFNDQFGNAISLSGDGSTLAVGAHYEDSGSTGINGNQNNDNASQSGAVYIFIKNDFGWSQEAYIKASNPGVDDRFGSSVSLNGAGNKLAVGAIHEGSGATGVNGNQYDESEGWSGAAYVFSKNQGVWAQDAYFKASNTSSENHFGQSVSMSADGNTLAVGAPLEYSEATGINGDGNQSVDSSSVNSGAAYIFSNSASGWSQDAYIKASNAEENDRFGYSLSLSGDGYTLAVGASDEDSSATDINGNQNSNSESNSGAVYIFTKNNSSWSQEAYIKASNTDEGDKFGSSVSLNYDGDFLAVGAKLESSSSIGLNGNQNNHFSTSESGAVYIYERSSHIWNQHTYVKSSNTDSEDEFGSAVSISGDGATLAVGANKENSSAMGINGNQNDNSSSSGDSGAVYVY